MRTSAAVQIRDLTREFVRQGHSVYVLVPAINQNERWILDSVDGAQVLRLKSPRTRDIGYVRRTLAEFWMPFAMLQNFRKCPLAGEDWDSVVWYAPSIFHGPFVSWLKKRHHLRSYLIVRDIFPVVTRSVLLLVHGLVHVCTQPVRRFLFRGPWIVNVVGSRREDLNVW